MDIFIIFCILWTLIGAGVGDRKGRAITGAFLGFLLGPIGVIGSFFLSYNDQCPMCRSGVPKGAVRCLKCHADFEKPV